MPAGDHLWMGRKLISYDEDELREIRKVLARVKLGTAPPRKNYASKHDLFREIVDLDKMETRFPA